MIRNLSQECILRAQNKIIIHKVCLSDAEKYTLSINVGEMMESIELKEHLIVFK